MELPLAQGKEVKLWSREIIIYLEAVVANNLHKMQAQPTQETVPLSTQMIEMLLDLKKRW